MIRRPPRSTLFPLHDALPIFITARWARAGDLVIGTVFCGALANVIAVSVYGFYLPANVRVGLSLPQALSTRSEEHTSELQSQSNLVCRLLLEKKNTYHMLIFA